MDMARDLFHTAWRIVFNTNDIIVSESVGVQHVVVSRFLQNLGPCYHFFLQ